jgi:hypothetical protein
MASQQSTCSYDSDETVAPDDLVEEANRENVECKAERDRCGAMEGENSSNGSPSILHQDKSNTGNRIM